MPHPISQCPPELGALIRQEAESAYLNQKVLALKQEEEARYLRQNQRATTLLTMLVPIVGDIFVKADTDAGIEDVMFFPENDAQPYLQIAGLTFTLIEAKTYTGTRDELVIERRCDKLGCSDATWHSFGIKCLADVGAVLAGEHQPDHSCRFNDALLPVGLRSLERQAWEED